MAILLEELLEVWREAERVLDQLPAGAPERKAIEVNVIELRSMHRLLTDQQLEQTDQLLASSREAIEAARRVIARTVARDLDPAAAT